MTTAATLPAEPGFRFRPDNFTQIPNDLFNLVLEGKLKDRDVTVYAYLLAKVAVAKAAFKNNYTAVPLENMTTELGMSRTTVKESVRSLAALNIIERVDTPGYTRTLILVKVADEKIVRASPNRPSPVIRKEDECGAWV